MTTPNISPKVKTYVLREAAERAFKDKKIRGMQRFVIGNWLHFLADDIEAGE